MCRTSAFSTFWSAVRVPPLAKGQLIERVGLAGRVDQHPDRAHDPLVKGRGRELPEDGGRDVLGDGGGEQTH